MYIYIYILSLLNSSKEIEKKKWRTFIDIKCETNVINSTEIQSSAALFIKRGAREIKEKSQVHK